ncbi:hypothetical protein ACFSYH_03190 [Populibacterium corticicola]|uniref:Uncharacterized protein n=1 Tax=Populibacterium corticicola TaxID=1812826 RepID=A0ABW5XCT5_9MICO
MKAFLLSGWVLLAAACVIASFALSATRMMPLYDAVTVVALIYACFALYKLLPAGFTLAWPRKSAESRSGARDEISQLAWLLFGRDRNVSYGGMKHVRESAETVFMSVGIDLNREADLAYVQQRVGGKTVAALTRIDRTLNQSELRRLVEFLDDIENVLQQHPLPHRPTTAEPALSSHQGDSP